MKKRQKNPGFFSYNFFSKNQRLSQVSSDRQSTSSLLSQRKVNQRFSLIRILPNSIKGVSEIIATVILIAIVMAVGGMVWVIVNNFVKGETGSTKSCFELFEKVNLESRYTCYNSSSGKLQFSISIGDVDVDEVLVGVSGGGTGVSFKIKKEPSDVSNVVMYPRGTGTMVMLPEKNAGLTYLFDIGAGLGEVPTLIQISPVVEGNQCEVSDTLSQIDNCAALAS